MMPLRIVIDTNVVISGTFFGGKPRQILEAVVAGKISAVATSEILEEYQDIVDEMIVRKQGHLRRDVIAPFMAVVGIVVPVSDVELCRDPDDDKFLSCAIDGKALYIVSGDKDLLDLKSFRDIEIVTAANFCQRYLS